MHLSSRWLVWHMGKVEYVWFLFLQRITHKNFRKYKQKQIWVDCKKWRHCHSWRNKVMLGSVLLHFPMPGYITQFASPCLAGWHFKARAPPLPLPFSPLFQRFHLWTLNHIPGKMPKNVRHLAFQCLFILRRDKHHLLRQTCWVRPTMQSWQRLGFWHFSAMTIGATFQPMRYLVLQNVKLVLT